MSPVGARGDHFGLMIKHVDAHDNDTGHCVLLLKEGGQGEKSQLELLVVNHLDRDCCCNWEKSRKFQLVVYKQVL